MGRGGQSECGHALPVIYKQGKGREAGLYGQYGDRGGGEAIGDPSLDPSPEGVEFVLHLQKGGEEVRAVQEDRCD